MEQGSTGAGGWRQEGQVHAHDDDDNRKLRVDAVGRAIAPDDWHQCHTEGAVVHHVRDDRSNETDDNIHLKELELLVTMVVEKMPPQRQKIYKMSRESGMNNEEIARELSINKRTVENHLSQALTDIRKALFITFILFF